MLQTATRGAPRALKFDKIIFVRIFSLGELLRENFC
jgi:hypothetical protein